MELLVLGRYCFILYLLTSTCSPHLSLTQFQYHSEYFSSPRMVHTVYIPLSLLNFSLSISFIYLNGKFSHKAKTTLLLVDSSFQMILLLFITSGQLAEVVGLRSLFRQISFGICHFFHTGCHRNWIFLTFSQKVIFLQSCPHYYSFCQNCLHCSFCHSFRHNCYF